MDKQQWHQFSGKLKRYLSRMLRRPEDVEDIAQEAFVRVLEAGSKGEIHYRQAYLFRTARNLALNEMARKSHLLLEYVDDIPELDALVDSHSPEDFVAGQQRFELFCHAVAMLPDQCRQVFVLRKVYGLSQQEVADRLGISISTTEKHLAKGMLRCAEQLQHFENSERTANAGHRQPTQRRTRQQKP